MPLIVEGGRIPAHWAERIGSRSSRSGPSISGSPSRPEECIRVALINNMPDPALEDTEAQFFELLESVSGSAFVLVKLYSLIGIPRTDRGRRHLDSFYFGMDDLWNSRCDAVIMTGTEPRQPDLRQEPYWLTLTKVLDWAEENTASTVLSCLAAHAGVLHGDGIPRHPLPDKQFGVFAFERRARHVLSAGGAEPVRFPHSRWNEVRQSELEGCGYTVLTQSSEGGVDSFVKERKRSLFVHFQGHPEYGAGTLLKEYRRDIKRFLRAERETYPTMPKGYFDAGCTKLMTDFRETVLSDRGEELMQNFPEAALARSLQKTWQASATAVYDNWLRYVASKKTDMPEIAVLSAIRANRIGERKRSALR